MRKCKVCGLEKEECEFSNGKTPSGKIALLNTCKDCRSKERKEKRTSNPDEQRKKDRETYQKTKVHRINYAREYRKKYPERTRETNLKYKYGITSEIFYKKLEEQENKCAICGKDMEDYGKIFCVDHNHETNHVRGLVCDPCNYGLGFYEKHKDKYEEYLKRFDK